jgi:hypothetical protein
MKSITLRECPPDVARKIQARAREKKLSLNRAVVDLLSEALNPAEFAPKAKHHDLDRFFGRWSKAEADRFDGVLKSRRRVDPDVWQ